MKTIKSVSIVLLFSILIQVPAAALWFSAGIAEKTRIWLVALASALLIIGIVENFRKRFLLSYADLGVIFRSGDAVKRDMSLALAACAAGLTWFSLYIRGLKLALPAVYSKLAAVKSSGYVSALMDWGRTFSFEGTVSLMLGMLVIVAAEELLFRGLIFNYIRREATEAKALFWSSGAFALVHLNPVNMPVTFVTGLLFAWVYKRSNSLVYPILTHFLYNLGIAYLGPLLH